MTGPTLRAIGDVLLGKDPPPWDEDGFDRICTWLQKADLAIGNLECPLVDEGLPIAKIDVARADRDSIGVVSRLGFRFVNLANNHIMDYGVGGLQSTIQQLKHADIAFSGAGDDVDDAFEPRILMILGTRVALVGAHLFFHLGWEHSYPRRVKATYHDPGAAMIQGYQVRLGPGKAVVMPEDAFLEKLCNSVRKARQNADRVVVSLHSHWGPRDIEEVDAGRRLVAHETVDAGADLIIGHGPHTINGVEIYKGKYIAHSLGNFFFNIPGAMADLVPDSRPFIYKMKEEDRFWHGLGLHINLQTMDDLVLIPLEIHREGPHVGMPFWATPEGAHRVRQFLEPQCTALGSRLSWCEESGCFQVSPA